MRSFESEKEDGEGARKTILTYGMIDSISDRNRHPMSQRGSVGTSIVAAEAAAAAAVDVGRVLGDEERERRERRKWNR